MNGIHEVRGPIPLSSTMYYVYILVSTVDGSLYTGQTQDLQVRMKRHNTGRVKSSRSRAPYRLAYVEEYATRAEAMWREWELKTKWNSDRKKKLISGFDPSRLVHFTLHETT